MNKYIEVLLVEAVPMTKQTFEKRLAGLETPGYKCTYPDGYEAWYPKDIFEQSHVRVGNDNSIKEHNINEFILGYEVSQWGDKTTVVHATLANGFIMTEASSCVDPKNFSISIGENICKENIQNKLLSMLGFMLQTALHGVRRSC